MHIVFVHRGMFPERVGGTYTYLYDLGSRLAAKGHEIDVIASTREPDPGPPYEVEGMKVHCHSFRKIHPVYSTMQHLSRSRKTYESIASRRPVDILSVNDSQLGLGAARSTLGRAACQVPTFHASAALEFRLNTAWQIDVESSRLKRAASRLVAPAYEHWQHSFEARLLRISQGILVLSEFTRSIIEEHFPSVDPGRVRIIPGGVDNERFRPSGDRAAVRRKLGINEGAITLITVRNLSPRMGLENLVDAMASVVASDAARDVDIRLLICGDGLLRDALADRIGMLGLEGRVSLQGRVSGEDLVRYYQAADLFVLPTTAMEGFGLVTVEALAANLPVIGTPAGATPEILTPIDQRLVTRDTTPDAIAEAIVGWLSWRHEDAGTTRYQDAAVARYSWGSIAERVESYYAEMLEKFQAPTRGASGAFPR